MSKSLYKSFFEGFANKRVATANRRPLLASRYDTILKFYNGYSFKVHTGKRTIGVKCDTTKTLLNSTFGNFVRTKRISPIHDLSKKVNPKKRPMKWKKPRLSAAQVRKVREKYKQKIQKYYKKKRLYKLNRY